MATLSTAELVKARAACALAFTVGYTKPQVNAALQAIEDVMTTYTLVAGDAGKTIQQLVSAAIDASSAFSWTNAQKKILFALWAELKYQKDKA